jgi:hypothetical protein
VINYYIDEVLWIKAEQTCYLVKVTCIYLCCRWRSNYQKGQFGIPLIGLIPIKLLCHSHIRTWISIIKRRVFFMFKSLVWEVLVRFADIDGIFYFYFLKLSLLLHRYFIFFFRKYPENWFKTWKHTSFVIFCYWYTWYKVNSLLVFHHNILSHVSKVNYHVHAVFFKSIKTLTIWHFGSLFLYL